MTFWDMELVQVTNILDAFAMKSLGTCDSDPSLDFPTIYSINVMLLEFLKIKEDDQIIRVYETSFVNILTDIQTFLNMID